MRSLSLISSSENSCPDFSVRENRPLAKIARMGSSAHPTESLAIELVLPPQPPHLPLNFQITPPALPPPQDTKSRQD